MKKNIKFKKSQKGSSATYKYLLVNLAKVFDEKRYVFLVLFPFASDEYEQCQYTEVEHPIQTGTVIHEHN